MFSFRFPVAILATLAFAANAEATAREDLAQQATSILQKYCTACHGPDVQEGGLQLDSPEAFSAGGDSKKPLAAARPEDSLLWTRVGVEGDMPPEDHPQPSGAEKLILKLWIQTGAAWPGSAPAQDTTQIAVEASAVFRKHCYSCHGQQFKAPGLDFAKFDSLVLPTAGHSEPFVTAGNPDASPVWTRIANESMPPKSQTVRLTSEEKAVVQEWIKAGAPRWPEVKVARPFVSDLDVLTAIRDHLRSLPESSQRHQRYFSVAHLHNNASVTDEQLAMAKAALSKVVNSLTWESDIVVPKPVDERQTVLAVDLRDLDWTEQNHWSKLFEQKDSNDVDERKIGYSYGLEFNDPQLDAISREIRLLSQSTPVKLCVRADWFVAKASRPPLYHELLELPDNATDLEERLEVTTENDWLLPDLLRGGVIQSKVSTSNRLLDRHRALHGAYWVSYDFRTSSGKGSLVENPLGPKFDSNPFNDTAAFEHDGGEIIFTLPNGLNGYLLVDGEKKRISRGPIDIVRDSNEFSGTPEVVTGVSCMGCHKRGVVWFEDVIRNSTRGFGGAERRKIEDLFAPQEETDDRLRQDEERFLNALLQAVRPFLPVSTLDDLRKMDQEPVGESARSYQADLDLAAAAAELGFEDPAQLQAAIVNNPKVRVFLGTLLRPGGVIKREAWESRTGGNSLFQTVASLLEKGVPVD